MAIGSFPLSPKLRAAAMGGVVGPAMFIGAWTLSAATTKHRYSQIHDAISRLAAVGSDTRPLMNAGFVGLGLSLPVYSVALRHAIGGRAWLTAAATGLATLAVAGAPLGHSSALDTWHGIFAGIGYLTLAATPLLAAVPVMQQGHRVLARAGLVAGAISAVALVLTLSDLPTGMLQRLGLTATDLWIAASALAIVFTP